MSKMCDCGMRCCHTCMFICPNFLISKICPSCLLPVVFNSAFLSQAAISASNFGVRGSLRDRRVNPATGLYFQAGEASSKRH